MKDTVRERVMVDEDGKMVMMDSASRLATTALAMASISMTLY